MTYVKNEQGLMVPDKKMSANVSGVSTASLLDKLQIYFPMTSAWIDGSDDLEEYNAFATCADAGAPVPGATNIAFVAATSDNYQSGTALPITGDKTISVNIASTNVMTTQIAVYMQTATSGADYLIVGNYASKLLITTRGGVATYSRASSTIANNVEYNIIIRKEAGNVKDLWVNGVEDTNAAGALLAAGQERYMFGGSYNSSAYGTGHTGTIGHYILFDGHLSVSEIKYIANNNGRLV